MTPTPSPDDINRIIDLINNSGNDQHITILLLIVLVMVSSVALVLILILRYKPAFAFLSRSNGSPISTLDRLVEVLAEYNENFSKIIEQEDRRIVMRADDLKIQRESLVQLHKKMDIILEHVRSK